MPPPLWLTKLLIRMGIAQRSPDVRRMMGQDVGLLRYLSDEVLTAPAEDVQDLGHVLACSQDSCIDLSLGAPSESCFPVRADEIAQLFEHSSRYPPAQGLPELRRAIAGKFDTENGLTFDAEHEVLVTNGAGQAASLAIEAVVNRGDRVALLDPTYLVYRFALASRGARVADVATTIVDGETVFDERALAGALRGAKLLILSSPCNPSGGMLSGESLDRIAYWVRRSGTIVLSDEVYERFVYEGTHISPAGLAHMRKRTLTANSLSKSHGMAGVRVGYIAGPRKLIEVLTLLQVCSTPFVPDPCQRLAARALAQPRDAFAPILERYRQRRALVADRLRQMGLDASLPAGAFYFFPSVASLGTSGREAAHLLAERFGVRVVPGHVFGPSGTDRVRISYAVESDLLEEALRRIHDFVRSR